MGNVHALFADYASHHQTKGNKVCHRIGIPLIVLSLFGMLARVPIWRLTISLDFMPGGGVRMIDAAMLLIVLAEIYYLLLEWRLALMMLVVSALFFCVGASLPLWLNIILFVLGWIFQFVGHMRYEHRQPAFFRNFLHLLIGPLWILNGVIPVVR